MSLIVREKAQPLLNEAGFSMFHAAMKINHGSPNLLLLRTVCGKQVAVVHGVEFSSANPTVKEIDYSMTLLSDWLTRNETKLTTYVEAWTLFEETDPPPKELNGLGLINNYTGGISVEFDNEYGVTFVIAEKGLQNVKWEGRHLPDDWPVKLNPTIAKLEEAKEFLHMWLEYNRLKDTVAELHGELTSCNY